MRLRTDGESTTVVDNTVSDIATLQSLCENDEYVPVRKFAFTVILKKGTFLVLFNLSNVIFFSCWCTELQEDLQLRTWKSKWTDPYSMSLLVPLIDFSESYIFVLKIDQFKYSVCSEVETVLYF